MVRSREMACGISFEATATSTVFFLLVSSDLHPVLLFTRKRVPLCARGRACACGLVSIILIGSDKMVRRRNVALSLFTGRSFTRGRAPQVPMTLLTMIDRGKVIAPLIEEAGGMSGLMS